MDVDKENDLYIDEVIHDLLYLKECYFPEGRPDELDQFYVFEEAAHLLEMLKSDYGEGLSGKTGMLHCPKCVKAIEANYNELIKKQDN